MLKKVTKRVMSLLQWYRVINEMLQSSQPKPQSGANNFVSS